MSDDEKIPTKFKVCLNFTMLSPKGSTHKAPEAVLNELKGFIGAGNQVEDSEYGHHDIHVCEAVVETRTIL